MTRRRLLLLVLALFALAVGGALLAVRRTLPLVPSTVAPADEIAGFWHLHTVRSHDGHGTLEEAVAAARASGGRFLIVTEHNKRALDPQPRWVDGVLVVHAIELSTPAGHLLVAGASPSPKRKSPTVLADAEANGGFAAPGHPVNRKRPWVGGDEGFAAFEALSLDSDFREALARPWRSALPLAALVVNPRFAPALISFDRGGLEAYDRIAARRPLALVCGVDAHGLPPYELSFAAYRLRVRLPPGIPFGQDAAADAAWLLAAIRAGATSCERPALGAAPGLRIERLGGIFRASTSATDPRLTLALICGGETLARGPPPTLEAAHAGPCRAEVRLRAGLPLGEDELLATTGAAR